MRTRARLVLAGLAAGLMLYSLAAAAAARNLSVTNQSIRATWSGLRFESKVGQIPPLTQFSCPVTLEGSFHSRTFPKVMEALIGVITRAIANHPCGAGAKEFVIHNGTETVLRGGAPATSLPWGIFYRSFTGTLPNITRINIDIQGIIITVIYTELGGCLRIYGSATESRPWVLTREAGGAISGLEPSVEPIHLIRTTATAECPQLAKLSGQSTTFTLLNATTRVTVSLI